MSMIPTKFLKESVIMNKILTNIKAAAEKITDAFDDILDTILPWNHLGLGMSLGGMFSNYKFNILKNYKVFNWSNYYWVTCGDFPFWRD